MLVSRIPKMYKSLLFNIYEGIFYQKFIHFLKFVVFLFLPFLYVLLSFYFLVSFMQFHVCVMILPFILMSLYYYFQSLVYLIYFNLCPFILSNKILQKQKSSFSRCQLLSPSFLSSTCLQVSDLFCGTVRFLTGPASSLPHIFPLIS